MQSQRASDNGMTLVEVLLAMTLLLMGSVAFLFGMHQSLVHADYLSQFQIAMNAAQGRLEELASMEFDALLAGNQFRQARGNSGQCMGMGEDRNCNGALDPSEDADGNGQLDEPLPGGRLLVQIRPVAVGGGQATLLDLFVSTCWQAHGRSIGEDQNCNGRLEDVEDVNNNEVADSPTMVSTRVALRD